MLATWPCHAQEQLAGVPRELMDFCRAEVLKDPAPCFEYNGNENKPSGQLSGFNSLKNKYPDTVFYALTYHKSPMIRAKAFELLLDKNPELYFRAMKSHINDRVEICTLNGGSRKLEPFADAIYFSLRKYLEAKKIILSNEEAELLRAFDSKSKKRPGR